MCIKILAIETSCDDTSASVLSDAKILSNVVSSQEIHKKYGGIVPEVASREHQLNIIPVVDQALKTANTKLTELSAVAFTRGPGLLGSLIVGVSFAKSLALSLNIPIIEVHHMQAHVLAHFIDKPYPSFPFLCLVVSGGHTQIIQVNGYLDMKIIGRTLDDAAGEAFDKSGKLLNLDYPAGPLIDKLAKKGIPKFSFPEPKVKGLNFSFSGLKTAILYFLKDQIKIETDFIEKNKIDICASIQDRIVSILLNKLEKAAITTGINEIAIAGGVSANSKLRSEFKTLAEKKAWNSYVPQFEYCTDNAAMIAIAAYFKYKKDLFGDQNIGPKARMPFELGQA